MKRLLLIFLFLVVGCSSITEKKAPLKAPLTYDRAKSPFSNSSNNVWYQVNYDTYHSASNSSYPDPVITIKLTEPLSDNSLLEVYYEVNTNNINNIENKLNSVNKSMVDENLDSIIYQRTKNYNYLGDTPFFILSEDNDLEVKKELDQFYVNPDSTINDRYLAEQSAKNLLLQKSNSIITIENKYIHKYSDLFFISNNGDIRSVAVFKILNMIEFGIKDYRDPNLKFEDKSFDDVVKVITEPTEFKKYLEETYGVMSKNDYYLISDVTKYIMDHGAVLGKLFEATTDDYLAYVYQNPVSLKETGKNKEKKIGEISKQKYNEERTRDSFLKFLNTK